MTEATEAPATETKPVPAVETDDIADTRSRSRQVTWQQRRKARITPGHPVDPESRFTRTGVFADSHLRTEDSNQVEGWVGTSLATNREAAPEINRQWEPKHSTGRERDGLG